MKRIKKILLVLVLLVIIALVGVVLYIDRIARVGIEKGATWALGVDTTLNKASIGLFSGKSGLATLEVKNPAGYASPHFLKLGSADLDLRLFSLFSDKVTIPRVTFKGIDVHLERNAKAANYDAIMENLKKFESQGAPPPENKEGKKFIIELLEIEDVTVHINLLPIAGLGDATKMDVKIPKISLKNIGGDDGGANMGEITDVVLKAVLTAVTEKAGGVLPADLLVDLKGKLASLESLDKMGVQMASEAIDMATQKIQDATKDLNKKIEGVTKDLTKDLGKDLTKDLGKDLGKDLKKGFEGLLPGGENDKKK